MNLFFVFFFFLLKLILKNIYCRDSFVHKFKTAWQILPVFLNLDIEKYFLMKFLKKWNTNLKFKICFKIFIPAPATFAAIFLKKKDS